jgi:hypothetical protein
LTTVLVDTIALVCAIASNEHKDRIPATTNLQNLVFITKTSRA